MSLPTDTSDDTGTPRWVKVFGILALVVVLLFAVLLLARGPGGRGHGPGRHAPPSVTEHGQQQR
jgi:hypothetical protein